MSVTKTLISVVALYAAFWAGRKGMFTFIPTV
jgi:hypothetical protein